MNYIVFERYSTIDKLVSHSISNIAKSEIFLSFCNKIDYFINPGIT